MGFMATWFFAVLVVDFYRQGVCRLCRALIVYSRSRFRLGKPFSAHYATDTFSTHHGTSTSHSLWCTSLSASCASCCTYGPSRSPAVVVSSIDFFPVWLTKGYTSSHHIQDTEPNTGIIRTILPRPTTAWICPLSVGAYSGYPPQPLSAELRILHRCRQFLLLPNIDTEETVKFLVDKEKEKKF